MNKRNLTERAKLLRNVQTDAESLLWSVLRAKQLCGLKFRRQHFIDSYIVDFACDAEKLVIEVDGEYHDFVGEKDLMRQKRIESLGWRFLRFENNEVLKDVDAIAIAICSFLGMEMDFRRRSGGVSGMLSDEARDQQ